MPTALWTAVTKGDTQRVIDLIAQKVDLNTIEGDQKETPIALAAMRGPFEIFKLLFDAGADPSIRDRRDRGTALHSHLLFYIPNSYLNPNMEYIRLLCSVNLDINARDANGETALVYATIAGYKKIAKFLLSQPNCEVNTVCSIGHTPLYIAVLDAELEIAECLITHGADLDLLLRDDGRWGTLLHHCIFHHNARGLRFLLRQGADETLKDRNGRTPLEFATNGRYRHAERVIAWELHTRKLRVLAFMFGTHNRLGELSWIRALDVSMVIDLIVRRYMRF